MCSLSVEAWGFNPMNQQFSEPGFSSGQKQSFKGSPTSAGFAVVGVEKFRQNAERPLDLSSGLSEDPMITS
jgi:hypothetical protein